MEFIGINEGEMKKQSKNNNHQEKTSKGFSSSPPNPIPNKEGTTSGSSNSNNANLSCLVTNGVAHLTQTIILPRRTYGHSVTLANKLIYIFGGCDESGNFSSSLFYLHPNSTSKRAKASGMTWTDLNQGGNANSTISSRHFHSCVEREGMLWIFGGKSNGYHNDLWRCTLKTGEWTKIKTKNTAPVTLNKFYTHLF